MKILCKHLIILAVIICCIAGIAISAQAEEVIASGTCGSNLRWSLDDTGTLTISGTGEMVNYTSASNVPWYTYRKSISSIIISDGITSIGDSAFKQCSSRSITIPKSVTSIGAWAFSESSLQSITIPDGVTSIGMHAFERCPYLKSITIPNGVTKISNCAFYKSGIQSITIPNSVTSIGVSAFSESSLTSIIIPNSVTNIEGSAFFNCCCLRKVTYCGTEEQWRQLNLDSCNAPLTAATRIYHNWNISSCTELKSCTICGESTIGHAWLGATCDKPETCSLCGVTEGDICHNVHLGICENCQQYGTCGENLIWTLNAVGTLTILGTGEMTDYGWIDEAEDWIESPWQAVATDIKAVVIEKGVTTIGCEAFYNLSNLTSVTIGDSVTSIGSNAFYDCANLTSITIGNSVSSIGANAFWGCSSLTSIDIPDSVTSIGDCAFTGCSCLTSITIPDSVTSINYGTFQSCSSLTSVTIPDSVTIIDDSAFRNCSSLTSITIPDSVTSIGYYAFSGCSSLTSITIPDSVTSINASAFSGCSSLTSITIPDSVTSINASAFSGCSSLVYNTYNNGLYLGNNTNPYIALLKSISLSTTSCEIHPDTKVIASEAFYGCTGLTSITIPNSIANIGSNAFYDCSNLRSITLGDNVTIIGDSAFSGCSRLTSITIPDSVTSIGFKAFYDCSSLAGVYITDMTVWYNIEFHGYWANPLFYAKNLYLNGELVTDLLIPDCVTYIGEYAFFNCSSITNITIGNSVTTIGWGAFEGCSNLASITIPDSVTSIGWYAFNGCSSLNHVAYTGTESQWNSISIGADNTNLKNASRHYETRFKNVDTCLEHSVYCPVCEEYLEYEPKNGEHNYGDWFITTPPTVTTEGEKEKVCSVCGDRVTETIPMLICGVSYWGISLEDDIGATFYLNLGDYDSENTSVAVQFDNTQRKYDLCDLTTVDGKYVLKVNVAAAQMCDDIIIQVLSDDAVIREMKYTIRQYAEYILNGNYSDEIKHLVQAMLNYGASTQKLFTHNTSNPANLGYEMTDVPEIPEASSNSVAMGTVDGIEYYGASLNCEAKISVKFYFTVTGNIKDYTFTDSKGNTYRAIYRAGMYCVEVPDINPADYDQIIKIIVHDGSSIMMVDYSPLRYISRKFYGSDDSNLVNMVAALYRYHKAAESYLDSL